MAGRARNVREADTTVREALRLALLEAPATARDLSKRVGISERDVADHLAHLERSVRHRGETLVVEPSTCLDCGFAFTERRRHSRPSGCPECRSRRISLPRFGIRRLAPGQSPRR